MVHENQVVILTRCDSGKHQAEERSSSPRATLPTTAGQATSTTHETARNRRDRRPVRDARNSFLQRRGEPRARCRRSRQSIVVRATQRWTQSSGRSTRNAHRLGAVDTLVLTLDNGIGNSSRRTQVIQRAVDFVDEWRVAVRIGLRQRAQSCRACQGHARKRKQAPRTHRSSSASLRNRTFDAGGSPSPDGRAYGMGGIERSAVSEKSALALKGRGEKIAPAYL